MTAKKIKIIDDDRIRDKICNIYEKQNQTVLAQWSLKIAERIIRLANIDIRMYPEIAEGFEVNERWQNNNTGMYDVRKIGFKIHKIAKEQNDMLQLNAFRVIGHAVASGHMKEHSIVASDYAVKVINLLYDNDLQKVREEREWQLKTLSESVER